MEEFLLAYAPAILAIAVAVILRLRRSHKEASKKIVALREELALLQHRNRELEQDLNQALEQAHDRLPSPTLHPALGKDSRQYRAQTYFADHAQIEKAFRRLEAIKTQLPLDSTVEEKYIAELDSIGESLEQATGTNLSRWLGIPPSAEQQPSTLPGREPRGSEKRALRCERDLFRFKILSLQAFCNYQIHESQRPSSFLASLLRDTRHVH